ALNQPPSLASTNLSTPPNPLSRQSALSTELTVDLNAVSDRHIFKVTRRELTEEEGKEPIADPQTHSTSGTEL
ncbi:MAG: hypothetical protein ACOYLK_04055, partial [Sphingomonas sp.]